MSAEMAPDLPPDREDDVLDYALPGVILAAEALARGPGAAGEARDALTAVRRALLATDPAGETVSYDPRQAFAGMADALAGVPIAADLELVTERRGHPDSLAAIVQGVACAARLESGARLLVELYEEPDRHGAPLPRVALTIDGTGAFDAWFLRFGADVATPRAWAERCWTEATRGGRIDWSMGRVELLLSGEREVIAREPAAGALRERVESALHALRLHAACVESGAKDAAEAAEALAEASGHVAGMLTAAQGSGPEPSSVAAAAAESARRMGALLEAHGVRTELHCEGTMPAIAVRRRTLVRAFDWAQRLAVASLPSGGIVTMLAEYEAGPRSAALLWTYSGSKCTLAERPLLGAIRWAIATAHGGAFAWATAAKEGDLEMRLPDGVGSALDARLPGWDRLGARAAQMLRLLWSGEAAPPEEVVLPGLLEHVLEQWLLPRLGEARAQHLAHELEKETKALAWRSPERMAKALGQVRRGKPRKELAEPGYAAELISLARSGDAARRVLGLEGAEDGEVAALCTALTADPIDFLACLRMVAGLLPDEGIA